MIREPSDLVGRCTTRAAPTESDAALGPWEGAAFMATGSALVLHILVDLPLWLSVATTLTGAGCVMFLAVRRHPEGLPAGRRLVAVGLRSAIVAVVAYDLTRLGLAEGLDFEVGPFEAFEHFGAGLLGTRGSPPTTATWVAGALFHVVNGITFGIAYTIVAGRRGVLAGITFGLALEVIMLGLYPAWLQIPNLREFASMSMLGHVAYGATLGHLARRNLERGEA